MSYDQIVSYIGGSGRYQISVFVALFTLKMFTGFQTLLTVIVAHQPEYQCLLNDTDSVPGSGSVITGKCFVFRNDTPELRIPCSQWTYEETLIVNTIVKQFNLVCNREYLIPLTSSMFFIGFIFGATLYGIASDRFGRLLGVLMSVTHLFTFSLAATFAQNIWTFGVLRLMSGIATGGLMTTLFTMGIEIMDAAHRGVYVILIESGFSFGGIVLSLLGYLIRDQFWIQITLALSMLIAFSFPLWINESPRWLLTTGRLKRADKVIRSIARMNKKSLPAEFDINSLVKTDTSQDLYVDSKAELRSNMTSNILAIFQNKYTALTTIIIWNYWFIVSLGYFGSYFTLGKIGDNLFIDMAIIGSLEGLTVIMNILTVKRLGRVKVLSLYATVGGITCILNSFLISNDLLSGGIKFLSITGMLLFSGGFLLSWFYAGEVFPTVVRNFCVGVCATWSRIGAAVGPQTLILYSIWKPLPILVMGILTSFGGIITLTLPETKNKGLTETMVDGKIFMESQFGISTKFRRRQHTKESMDSKKKSAHIVDENTNGANDTLLV